MEDFRKLFDSFTSLKVGVIGDLMLDTYLMGRVDRISPEAPVPVVSLEQKDYRIGGAGNVALNCVSLGASVTILSVLGKDEEGVKLAGLLDASGIDTGYLVHTDKRITTNKMRIISRNQQMLRLDSEVIDDINEQQADLLLQKIDGYIRTVSPDIIILEDYNKGVLTQGLIPKLISVCKTFGVKVAVDPKRKNFFAYQGVDIFKPNLKEVKEGLNLLPGPVDIGQLLKIHAALYDKLNHHVSFITLSEQGVFYQQEKNASLVPSHLRNVADVSGAGDTVIAVAAVVYAATQNVHLMAEIANIAGGLVCEQVGTVAIDKEKLLQECELLLS